MGHADAFGSICRLAASTGSVIDNRRLRAATISTKQVRRFVRNGMMLPMTSTTYAVGPDVHEPTMEMWCTAGVLDGGPGSHATGVTAARRVGLWRRGDETEVHVAVPTRGRQPSGPIRFHQFEEQPQLGAKDGLAVLGTVELARSLARTFTPWQLAAFMREAAFHTDVTIDDFRRAATSWVQCPYVTVVREALALLDDGSAGTREMSEDIFVAALRCLGWPVPLINVRGVMGIPGDEPDCTWLAMRKNVEIDGKHHKKDPQLSRDLERDALALALGWLVLRIDAWRLFYDLQRVMDEVATFLFGRGITSDERRRIARIAESPLTKMPSKGVPVRGVGNNGRLP